MVGQMAPDRDAHWPKLGGHEFGQRQKRVGYTEVRAHNFGAICS